MDERQYNSPFSTRYGSKEMRHTFSDYHRHMTWRKLWLVLAEAQKHCGIPITDQQIEEMKAVTDIDYNKVAEYEKETLHDVMAHIMEFSDRCPTAKNIIHLGATSCYVTDNADMILMHEAMQILRDKLKHIVLVLAAMADDRRDVPIVGRTHLQRAQLTTVGKRICMWVNDLDIAYDMLCNAIDNTRLLGYKGATGSQASAKTLFDGDYNSAQYVDGYVSTVFEIKRSSITGQTYTRLYDSIIANALSILAQATTKMATDIRLMACFGEMYEGFSKGQVGSSAMPYKRNPITCEKVCGLSRHIICNAQNMATTAATQWLERTLDDSSNRRLSIPELFMAADEVLISIGKIIDRLTINVEECAKNVADHAKMASLEDDIIMRVLSGGNRQEEHQNAIYSEGSTSAHINTGFASEQVKNYCWHIRKKYGAPQILW